MKTFSEFLNEKTDGAANKQTFKIRPFKVKLFGKMMTVYRVFDEKNEVVQVGSTKAEAEAWVTQNGALIEAYEDGEIDGILDSVIEKMSCDDEDGDEMNESPNFKISYNEALKKQKEQYQTEPSLSLSN